MSTIDIRSAKAYEPIDRIQFAEEKYGTACYVTKTAFGNIYMEDADRDNDNYPVDPEDIPNLILALQKAVELGWSK